MKATCPSCGTSFRVPDEKIPPQGTKARCARCKHVFEIRLEAAPAVSPAVSAFASESAPVESLAPPDLGADAFSVAPSAADAPSDDMSDFERELDTVLADAARFTPGAGASDDLTLPDIDAAPEVSTAQASNLDDDLRDLLGEDFLTSDRTPGGYAANEQPHSPGQVDFDDDFGLAPPRPGVQEPQSDFDDFVRESTEAAFAGKRDLFAPTPADVHGDDREDEPQADESDADSRSGFGFAAAFSGRSPAGDADADSGPAFGEAAGGPASFADILPRDLRHGEAQSPGEFSGESSGESIPPETPTPQIPPSPGIRPGILVTGVTLLLAALVGAAWFLNIWPMTLLTPDATQQAAAPGAKTPAIPEAVNGLTLEGLRQYYVANDKIGQTLVIEGKVVNRSTGPRELVKLKAELLDQADAPLATRELLAGNSLSLFQLQTLGKDELEQALNSKVGVLTNNANIQPGGETPFMLLFHNPPETVKDFKIEVVDAKVVNREGPPKRQ